MQNIPQVRIGLIAVSRDCFPADLSRRRRDALLAACTRKQLPVTLIETLVENERDVVTALAEIADRKVNALVVYLGNFGPEGTTTMLMQRFGGPCMLAAAAEETHQDLFNGRGDAYCGMLNVSYNVGLRRLRPHIPAYPVGTPDEVAGMIADFIPAARAVLGLAGLKIFSFGPRPQDFLACNAPIKPLYDLGVEIMENSELDLYDIFRKAEQDPAIDEIVKNMTSELGTGNTYPDLLRRQAQYEAALLRFMRDHLGARTYGIFANKCWPAFESYFGMTPCYVNGRLAARGIPVSCEVDIYGALSEYLATCVTELPATLLDINNTVPADMFAEAKKAGRIGDHVATDLFMGFHCGNTAACLLNDPTMKYQLIMHRLMEPGRQPDITRGTLEGTIKAGEITLFRLQATADAQLRSYIAEGSVLEVNPKSFGSIGVFAVKNMGRFYRHVLIGKRFPHHTAVAFCRAGRALYDALAMLGVEDVSFPLPPGTLYPTENPFR